MYYYNLAPNTTNYMQTMLAVQQSLNAQDIPVRFFVEFDFFFFFMTFKGFMVRI